MAILVTGGAGYIGSHTCVELLNAGKEVVLLDNFCNSKPEALEKIRSITGKDFTFYAVDLLHEAGIRQLFAEQSIEAVIHFAGLKAVGESVEKPMEYYHNNLTGTLLLCRVMAEAGCKKMVFSSSATVYGPDNISPLTEDLPTSATNPYGMTKLVIERILTDIAAADPAWSIALLRYFNPIGAHKSGLIGDDPAGIPNNLVPYVAQVAAGKLAKLTVHGNDFDTHDGTGVRDYLHVVDLALGHLKALDYVQAHTGAEAFNLGAGKGYSVLDIVAAFEKASGRSVPYEVGPRRAGDIATCYADPTKAAEKLGWKVERDLNEMCADMWNFAKETYLNQ
ncbi:UDP-glucose 4-epimerase GalE [Ruminococcaceae bacterium OttesenSCG-928-L11]|nr:UDP-glucose 4-epimerase GalE [Ruminococcaceae bacterium OttesenSCG-928-L11]